MLWHYTDRDSAADIRRAGLIRAQPVVVLTALTGGAEVELAPAAWFTPAADLPGTVAAKLQLGGWPLDRPGMVWRFGVADEAAPLDLPAWAHPHGYDPGAFRFLVLTAQLAGEDWREWRLSAADVPAHLWLAVQSLRGGTWVDEVAQQESHP